MLGRESKKEWCCACARCGVTRRRRVWARSAIRETGDWLGLSTASTINSAAHQDIAGTGLGMASYLKAPTELAATSAGWGLAKWIPFVGAAMDVGSAWHDGSQAYSDYTVAWQVTEEKHERRECHVTHSGKVGTSSRRHFAACGYGCQSLFRSGKRTGGRDCPCDDDWWYLGVLAPKAARVVLDGSCCADGHSCCVGRCCSLDQ